MMRVFPTLVLSMIGIFGGGLMACAGESEPFVPEPKIDEPFDENGWDSPTQPHVFTVPGVMEGESPVLLVVHDAGKTGWQFLDGKNVALREPVVVEKWEMLQTDDSLGAIIDLPVGWIAERADAKSPWVRSEFAGDDSK